jgi:hypothetical protein
MSVVSLKGIYIMMGMVSVNYLGRSAKIVDAKHGKNENPVSHK